MNDEEIKEEKEDDDESENWDEVCFFPLSFRLYAKLEGPRCMARRADAVLCIYIYVCVCVCMHACMHAYW